MKYRKCNMCHEWKGFEEFAKDTTKTGGWSYTCKECKREYAKSMRRTRHDFKRAHLPTESHMMTDETFRIYYTNEPLRDYIRTQAIRYSKRDRTFQQDLIQVAWGRVALCKAGRDTDYYKSVAHRAIKTEWQRGWMIREYGLSGVETMTAEECMLWQRGTM